MGQDLKKLLNRGSSKLFERSSENLNRFSDDLCFGTGLCFVLFVFHRFGRNGREPANQKQQHADDDEGGDAGDAAAVGKLDEEEFDDDNRHQRRAGYPEGAQFAAVAVHHQDDGGHCPHDGEAGLQAEGLEHDVESPSDAVVEVPQAHHARADDHECEGGDAGRVHAAVFQRQGFGQGLQGKPKHSGAGELQRVKQRDIRQRRGLERSGEVRPYHPTCGGKGGYRQGEMLIGGLMSSEKAALPLRMKEDPHDQRYGKPRELRPNAVETLADVHSRPKRPKDADQDDVEFVQVDRRIGLAVVQNDEVQHGGGGKRQGCGGSP